MARWDWEPPEEIPDDWDLIPSFLYSDLSSHADGLLGDTYAQELYYTAMHDETASRGEREEAYQALVDYLWDEYEIEFEDVYDWEDFRAWYESA